MTEQALTNQQRRTRKDLLQATNRLLKNGRKPSMAEIAEEAMVSRATAYRYFASLDALLCEALLDGAIPVPDDVLANTATEDPPERVDKVEAALHEVCYANETQLRLMLAYILKQQVEGDGKCNVPMRQNRRSDLIDAALAPVRDRFDHATYAKLRAALALFFGTESLIVFEDVLQVDKDTAREIKSWAIRSLVQAALDGA